MLNLSKNYNNIGRFFSNLPRSYTFNYKPHVHASRTSSTSDATVGIHRMMSTYILHKCQNMSILPCSPRDARNTDFKTAVLQVTISMIIIIHTVSVPCTDS